MNSSLHNVSSLDLSAYIPSFLSRYTIRYLFISGIYFHIVMSILPQPLFYTIKSITLTVSVFSLHSICLVLTFFISQVLCFGLSLYLCLSISYVASSSINHLCLTQSVKRTRYQLSNPISDLTGPCLRYYEAEKSRAPRIVHILN